MNYRHVTRHIDRGRGKAGHVLGPPCSVYRIGATASGNYLDAAQRIETGLHVMRRITTDSKQLEAPTRSMGTLFYELLVDATNWLTGDVFVENDPFYGAGDTIVDYTTTQFAGYCLAFHGPVKKIIGARIDRAGLIYRPLETVDSSNVWSPTLSTGQVAPLVLSGGTFSFGAVGATPTQVPMGLMSTPRVFRPSFRDIPGDTKTATYYCYLPPLNGYTPRSGDRIVNDSDNLATGSRYVVMHPYEQEAGIQGSQLVLEREIDPG